MRRSLRCLSMSNADEMSRSETMPTCVDALFREMGLDLRGPVEWEEILPCNKPGVYVVSLPVEYPTAPLDRGRIVDWMDLAKCLELDGTHPSIDQVVTRLERFWLPDEAVVYIGQTTKQSLRTRVTQFYRHGLGKKRQHCGGSWIKALSTLDLVAIYWATCESPSEKERQMLQYFADNVSPDAMAALHDPQMPLPFANLRHRSVKKHGFRNWTV